MSRAALNLFSVLMIVMLAACGGGGGGGGDDCDGFNANNPECATPPPGAATVSTLDVIAEPPALSSDANTPVEGVEITATALDANNVALSGATVTLSASSGSIQSASSTTDDNGRVTGTLTTGGDPQNRDIIVRATSGFVTSTVTVPVVGTQLSVTGPDTLGFGATATYTVTLTDSGGDGISARTVALSSNNANTPSPSTVTTNISGQATFTVTGNTGGATTLTATALGLTASKNVTVSADNLSFLLPAANAEINLNTPTIVRARLLNNGNPVVGTTISFSATRGTISGGDVSATQDMTDGSGIAQVSITSSNAGPALLTATGPNGLVTERSIEFVAVTPASIDIQASPAAIPTNSQSNITAIVRDASGNLVKNRTVLFSLADVTGGSLSAGSAVTDSQGSARVVYSSTSTSSATNGVRVTGQVQSTAISDFVELTVGGEALRITMGTGNEVGDAGNGTLYTLPFALFVTDANGTPVPDAEVTLSIRTLAYQKGQRVATDTDGNTVADTWVEVYGVADADLAADTPDRFGCRNEDANSNGVLDAGEDDNNNGTLQPTGDAFVPGGNLPLDQDDATAFFNITYPKNRADWVRVRLRARATVAGTETTEEAIFVLPTAASDTNDLTVAPPGQISPYGDGNAPTYNPANVITCAEAG